MLAVGTASSVSAQWQAHSPTFPDTIGSFDLRIAHNNSQTAWAMLTKSTINPNGFYNWVPSETLFFAKTTDGGNTWSEGLIPMGPAPYPSSISGVDANNAWAAGTDSNYASYIMRTEDGGTTWTPTLGSEFSGPNSYVDFVHFWDAQNGIAMGDPAESDSELNPFWEIYTTSDGGQNWNRVGSEHIPAAQNHEVGSNGDYFVSGDHIWFPAFDYIVSNSI